jgi:hypothetical protein
MLNLPYWIERLSAETMNALRNDLWQAEYLARMAFRHRWLLQKKRGKRQGARVLTMAGEKVALKPGDTATHYFARECVRRLQKAKELALRGLPVYAQVEIAKAQVDWERLYSSWLYAYASPEARRVSNAIERKHLDAAPTRASVERILKSLPKPERYSRGVTQTVCDRVGLSANQARAHIAALGYGWKNRKRSV